MPNQEPNKEWQWPEIGQARVIEFLERAKSNNKIAQTYIFVGPGELGKSSLALAFARNLQAGRDGFDSDLQILEREPGKKSISIAQTREFIKRLQLSSFLNSYKIGIIKEADLLSEEAKSALLKTLEEPQDKVVIILLLEEENNLPATILSRAQLLRFQPVPAAVIYDYLLDNYGAGRALAKDLANLALGRPLVAVRWLENQEEYQKYLEKAAAWLKIFSLDLNERLAILDRLFSDKTWSEKALFGAGEVLDLAESLSRDLFLLSLGQPEKMQNLALRADLNKALEACEAALSRDSSLAPVSGGVGIGIIRQLKLIAQAREYLAGNVNPRLVLEQLVSNIC